MRPPQRSPSAPPDCDVLVVGGGIHGVGIARDLAGRGLSVVLCERDDLASHTSSSSTKLAHGGLRYLEQGAFGLVRKALQERERLFANAPHIARPIRFVMPHDPALRPAWLVRVGLVLYDHLARRTLPRSGTIDLRTHVAGRPLKNDAHRAFVYSDGWVDDARLVVINAIDARERGATVLTRTVCVAAERRDAGWVARLETRDGAASAVRARALVDATGPWAGRLLEDAARPPDEPRLRLVKGSHIVVAKLFDHAMAYVFQGVDRRIVFAIPYEDDFTLIGTTDVEVADPGDAARVDAAEVEYLCAEANRHFARAIAPSDVVRAYAGIRSLVDDASIDASAITREYALHVDRHGAPLLTVVGGKLTTYRRLAEEAADRLCTALGHRGRAWTSGATLPGGDLGEGGSAAGFATRLLRDRPWLPDRVAQRWARSYGARALVLLGSAHALADLGREVAPGLHEAELAHLVRDEWAREADDVLWRRTKLGLHLDAAARARVAAWFDEDAR